MKNKRFTSLLVVVGAFLLALFFGNPEQFAAFAQSVAAVYGAYLAGQSATDWQKTKNGADK